MNPYPTSRDYALLVRLMEEGHQLVCFVDYMTCRDVAKARFQPPFQPDYDPDYQVHARGIAYLSAITPESFQAECALTNLEFILPDVEPHSPNATLRQAAYNLSKFLWDNVAPDNAGPQKTDWALNIISSDETTTHHLVTYLQAQQDALLALGIDPRLPIDLSTPDITTP